MFETLASIPFDHFATSIYPALILAGASMLANHKKGQADAKFRERQNEIDNAESRDRWDMQNAERMAMMDAQMKQAQAQSEAGRARLQSQRDAFGLTQQASDAEEEQRKKFAAALEDFSQKNKKASLAEAKAKRSGRAAKAAKGAKVSGTSGRAGRLSGAFRSGARSAVTAGLNKSATTAGMQAGLTGYGADLNRERGLFADIAGQGAVVGEQVKNLDKLGALRERLGNREYGALMDEASSGYLRDTTAAHLLNNPGPEQRYGGSPNYGVWDDIGAGTDFLGTAYGAGAFDKKPTGYGATYGPGTAIPRGYVGNNAPYLAEDSPIRQTRQYQGY